MHKPVNWKNKQRLAKLRVVGGENRLQYLVHLHVQAGHRHIRQIHAHVEGDIGISSILQEPGLDLVHEESNEASGVGALDVVLAHSPHQGHDAVLVSSAPVQLPVRLEICAHAHGTSVSSVMPPEALNKSTAGVGQH